MPAFIHWVQQQFRDFHKLKTEEMTLVVAEALLMHAWMAVALAHVLVGLLMLVFLLMVLTLESSR